MTNNLKIEVLVSNIPEDGSIASQFPSQEYVNQQLAKKANLSPEGRLDPAQAPDYTEIPGLYEHIEDTKDGIESSIASSLQDAKGYTNQQLSEGLRTKADLVNGKIPFDQIPFSADIEDQIQNNVENITAVVDQKVAQVVEQVNGVATAANSYTDNKFSDSRSYVDSSSKATLEDAKAYADSIDSLKRNEGGGLPFNPSVVYKEGALVNVDGEIQVIASGVPTPLPTKPIDEELVMVSGDKNLKQLNAEQQELNRTLAFKFGPLAKGPSRTLMNKLVEQVSIADFGAIGDGSLHTLQEWIDAGIYTDLSDIQSAFPFVTNLSQSIDWVATQHATLNHRNIYCPPGSYVLSNCVKTPHNTTPYNIGNVSHAITIFGVGPRTNFTRLDIRPATRIKNVEGTCTTQESDVANSLESCFSVHSPYTSIKRMALSDSPIGLFLGQDYTKPFTSLSNVSKSRFSELQIDRCGTGVLLLAAGGNHYSTFEDIHFSRCQIDVHQRSSNYWTVVQGRGDSNNNRNVFSRIRSVRSRIGLWNECGDTNLYYAWHSESMPSTANPFTLPEGLPPLVTQETHMVFSGSNQLNTIMANFSESVAQHVYNDGYQNRFVANGLQEDKVILVQMPREWKGRYVSRDRGIGFCDNTYSAFSDMSIPGQLYLGIGLTATAPINGVRVVSKDNWHAPVSNTRGSFKREFQIETGAVVANTPTAFTIWGNVDGSCSAMIELDIVGRCDVTGQTSTYVTKAIVNAYKASTRVPSRFSISQIFNSRSTGENAQDTTAPSNLTLAVIKNPSVPQELQVTISCPYDLTNATIFVKQAVTK